MEKNDGESPKTDVFTFDKQLCPHCQQMVPGNRLVRHDNVCDAKKMNEATQSLPFYKLDTNGFCNLSSLSNQNEYDEQVVDEEKLFDRIKSLYKEHIGEIRQITSHTEECKSMFEVKKGGENSTKTSQRHREQEASIVYHMQANNILSGVDTFIELGAGKARLSSAIGLSRPDATYICVERSAYKTKAENHMSKHYRARVDLKHVDLYSLLETYSAGNGERFEAVSTGSKAYNNAKRARDRSASQSVADDVNADGSTVASVSPSSPSVVSEPVTTLDTTPCHVSAVCVGKHLCGPATDFSLKAMKQLVDSIQQASLSPKETISTTSNPVTPKTPATDSSSPSPSSRNVPVVPQLCGFAIATCCHAACSYEDSAAFDFLFNICHITANEFAVMRKWCGFFQVDQNQRKLEKQWEAVDSLLTVSTEVSAEITDDVEGGGGTEFSMGNRARSASESRLCRKYSERALVGRYCKRLIDFGRLEYVKKHTQLKVEMVYYVEEETSPENCLIIGYN